MAEPTLSVVVATVSRPTLARALRSLAGQDWRAGDEVLVIGDGPQPAARELCGQLGGVLPLRYAETPVPLGLWGHGLRNWALDGRLATGDYLLALDDDDEFTRMAVRDVRAVVSEVPHPRPHIFRGDCTRIGLGVLWRDEEVRLGNVGTGVLCLPNDPARLGRYAPYYGGDFDFCRDTCAFYPAGPAWRPEVIMTVRPPW